ncbi:hypothetical protein AB0C08_18280 [Microbispora bryophytorum]|uniref:hypothetical protein n=1 Tax=Microbispora bryophytorum TaxID=1460882 RepID=UPI0033ED0E63
MCGAALKDADVRGANLSGANMRNITGAVKAAIQARWLPPMAPLFSDSSVLTEPRRGSELLLRRPLLMIRAPRQPRQPLASQHESDHSHRTGAPRPHITGGLRPRSVQTTSRIRADDFGNRQGESPPAVAAGHTTARAGLPSSPTACCTPCRPAGPLASPSRPSEAI